MVRNRKFILANHFKGEPKLSDFQFIEEDLPNAQDGEILCEALWFSVDPYMRVYTARYPAGNTMIGLQVARVVESKHQDYKVGDNVVGFFGWQIYSVCNVMQPPPPGQLKPYIIPDFGDLPLSLALGILGRPGNSAYFGFLELCKPKAGDVVVVSGAAGAVGSHVGQIAHIKGCKVIGFAGSDDKVTWLKEELNFDHAFNYKTTDLAAALKSAAPEGIDCYFDNVGGQISSVVLSQMKLFGRISVCGSISSYNVEGKALQADIIQPSIVGKQLKMEGFLVARWLDRFMEGIKQNLEWVQQGKLKYRETVTEGFENLPHAFIGMMKGENFGKAVVQA